MPGTAAVERVLAIMAHPDDVDFGAGGSIALWVAGGAAVSYCVVTDGAAGGLDRGLVSGDLARIRQAEQIAAGLAVGVEDVVFLGYPDGRLTVSLDLRRDLSRVIRERRPDRVVCQSPERNWARIHASHPDHLAAGEATLSAVYPDSRNPFAHPELLADGLEPHTVPETWIAGGPQADVTVDITDTFAQKLAALRCHQSQIGDMTVLESRLREWAGVTAADGGLPAGRLAEAFRVVNTR